ncbi:MAG: hypothetical protein JSR97_06495 [Verrucomicrobia bacterium]|nr:hypothetical protein [Verrucomicrobiota bacterium]
MFILASLSVTACSNRQGDNSTVVKQAHADTVFKHDTVYLSNQTNWQEDFGLTHDPEIDSIWFKPVKFYIDNPKCSPIAIDFYQGQFRPTDNQTTEALLKLVATDDNNLRPFYRWCLNKTIQIQDGALAEYTGVPSRKYAEKFPKEFFQYMDIDTTSEKYKDWVGAISYSGFYDNEDYKKTAIIRQRMTSLMKQNCKNCSIELQSRIDKFAKDCFP